MVAHPHHAQAKASVIRKHLPRKRPPITAKQREFIDEYMTNGQMGAPAYRKVFKLEGSTKNCAEAAWRLLNNPNVARIIESTRRQLARIQDGAFEQLQASEERIIEAIAALAFYDPRYVVQWGPDGAVFSVSSDLPLRSVLAIKEISYIQGRASASASTTAGLR